jgi:hypothetical protein
VNPWVLLPAAAAITISLDVWAGLVGRTRWSKRGIFGPLSHPLVTALRLLLPTLAAALTIWTTNDGLAAIATATVTWLAIIATVTDLGSCKVPREACWATFTVTSASALATMNTWQILSALIAVLASALAIGLTVLISRGRLGSGDLRFVIALSPLAAWFGPLAIMWGLIAASVLQIPARLIFRRIAATNGRGAPFIPALVAGITISIIISALSEHSLNIPA